MPCAIWNPAQTLARLVRAAVVVMPALTALGLVSFAAAQPANDACSSASQAPIPSTGGIVAGTVVGATSDGKGCGLSTRPGRDVYHTFIPATAGPWRLSMCSSPEWDTVLSIHRNPTNSGALACPTTAANRVIGACDDDGCSFFGEGAFPSQIPLVSLEPGVLYTIRVAGFSADDAPDAYTLEVSDLAVVNDRCQDAATSPVPGIGGDIPGTLADATTDGSVALACIDDGNTATVRDVYHEFVPATSGVWTLTTCVANSPADTVVSIHTACPANASNAIACADNGCAALGGGSYLTANLTAGTRYIIRVAEPRLGSFTLVSGSDGYILRVNTTVLGRCCSNSTGFCTLISQAECTTGQTFTAGQPCGPNSCPVGSYDVCTSAATLTLGQDAFGSTQRLTGTALASCTTETADAWFRFVAPAAGTYQINLAQQSANSILIASVFVGTSCPTTPGTEIVCVDSFQQPVKFTLASGATARIRVVSTPSPTNFRVQIQNAAAPPPSNDLCGNPRSLTRNTAVAGTLEQATPSLLFNDLCGLDSLDVWYSFTANNTNRTIVTVTPAAGSGISCGVSISTTCVNAGQPIACAGASFTPEATTSVIFQPVSGTTYRIRVAAGSPGAFSILLANAPTAPANDACSANIALTLNTARNGTTLNASGSGTSINDDFCASPFAPDVWYRFRPSAAGMYEVVVSPAAAPDPTPAGSFGLSLYSACPTTASDVLDCISTPGLREPLILGFIGAPNTDVFIRVVTSPADAGNFSIVVRPAETPIGACCVRDGGCAISSQQQCVESGGTYLGNQVSCNPPARGSTGCSPAGRCCFSSSSACTTTRQIDCTGPGATFTLNGICDAIGQCPAGSAPSNDTCPNAINLASFPATIVGANDLASAEGPQIPAGFCNGFGAQALGLKSSVYYRFVAPFTGVLTLRVNLMTFAEPVIVVYEGQSCADLVDVGCAFRFQAGQDVEFNVTGGTSYWLAVGLREQPEFPFNFGGPFNFSASIVPAQGACCRGTSCAIEASNLCATNGGQFAGTGVVCGTAANPTTCCRANFDGVNGVQVADIFTFLAAWFSSDPRANINGNASVDVPDIFAFLALWFAGC